MTTTSTAHLDHVTYRDCASAQRICQSAIAGRLDAIHAAVTDLTIHVTEHISMHKGSEKSSAKNRSMVLVVCTVISLCVAAASVVVAVVCS
jgi:hypothetical protein